MRIPDDRGAYIGVTAWAKEFLAWNTNLAGQAIRPVVHGDPDAEAFYASLRPQSQLEDECHLGCGRMLTDSECEGQDFHCQTCRDDEKCRACNGAPSVKP